MVAGAGATQGQGAARLRVLTVSSHHLADVDQNLLGRLQRVNSTLSSQISRLQNIRKTIAETAGLAEQARGRVQSTERLIEIASRELERAKVAAANVVRGCAAHCGLPWGTGRLCWPCRALPSCPVQPQMVLAQQLPGARALAALVLCTEPSILPSVGALGCLLPWSCAQSPALCRQGAGGAGLSSRSSSGFPALAMLRPVTAALPAVYYTA